MTYVRRNRAQEGHRLIFESPALICPLSIDSPFQPSIQTFNNNYPFTVQLVYEPACFKRRSF